MGIALSSKHLIKITKDAFPGLYMYVSPKNYKRKSHPVRAAFQLHSKVWFGLFNNKFLSCGMLGIVHAHDVDACIHSVDRQAFLHMR